MNTVRLEAVKTSKTGQVGAEGNEIPMQPASQDIWDKRYRLKTKAGEAVDADIDATYRRVAKALAEAEPGSEKQAYWYERFVWALRRGAIPAGRITTNAGALEHKPASSTINCTVSGTIEDSMDGILEKVHEAGLTPTGRHRVLQAQRVTQDQRGLARHQLQYRLVVRDEPKLMLTARFILDLLIWESSDNIILLRSTKEVDPQVRLSILRFLLMGNSFYSAKIPVI